MSNKTSSRTIQSEPSIPGSEVLAALTKAARERILILDGAMGTQIQGLGFGEDHFRGEQFVH
jgi:5-methyltetrahydrofolate--homocysteine methyltransferase